MKTALVALAALLLLLCAAASSPAAAQGGGSTQQPMNPVQTEESEPLKSSTKGGNVVEYDGNDDAAASASASAAVVTDGAPDGETFVFSANGLLVKQTVKRWTQDAPDEKCKRDTAFLIDNSGSMSEHRVPMFTALNVAIQTLREKGHSRVSTIVFSDSPKVFGPPPANARYKNSVATDKCAFCWKQSNLKQQPFPDPNKVRGGTLTDLAAGVKKAISVMRDDIAGKGPAADGPRANPQRPYRLIMSSDLLNTKGMSSANSQAFRKLEDMMFSVSCGENWRKFLVRQPNGGYTVKNGKQNKVKDLCKGAIAEFHYFIWTRQSAKHRDMKGFLEKVKNDNVKGLKDLQTAWRETSVAKWRSYTKSSSLRVQTAMYDLFTGQTQLGGATYHAKATVVPTNKEVISVAKWTQMDLIKEILGDCEPLEFEQTTTTVDVQPAELPKLDIDIDPLVRHFANAKTLIDPNYVNSLGKDEMSFLSAALEKFRDQVADLKDTIVEYTENLQTQLADYEKAAATNGELKRNLPTVQAKVNGAIKKAKDAEAVALTKAMKLVHLSHVFVGGFASTKGFNPVSNQKFSNGRAVSAFCMLGEIFKAVSIGKYSVTIGSFGHQWHCNAILDLVGTPGKSCADTKAVTDASVAWANAGEDAETVAERKQELVQLEDEARKAEVHFQAETAAAAGFKGRCCLAVGGAQCTLAACPTTLFSAETCADKSKWQTGWTAENKAAFESELKTSSALLDEIRAMTSAPKMSF